MKSFAYFRRVLQAYLGLGTSQLSFWHETPAVNEGAFEPGSLQYYMTFHDKAFYKGPFDESGMPLLDYRGKIGRQYNPIAVAQYGLACWNRWGRSDDRGQMTDDREQPDPCLAAERHGQAGREESEKWREKAIRCADWLVGNLEQNKKGLWAWHHKFDWEYFRTLKAPWYSGLAQGMGLSLLVRVARKTGEEKYREAADRAFAPLAALVAEGGTRHVDDHGDWWIEEYITEPPTHILNGFMWALWGVKDYAEGLKAEGGNRKGESGVPKKTADELWERGVATLEKNLERFDCGYWSLYDLSPLPMKNMASPFYHRLHIVQLDVMHRLTGREVFREYGKKWQEYAASPARRIRAFAAKATFKLAHF